MSERGGVPDEWRDLRRVMPHLVELTRHWELTLRELEVDLAVIQGALDPGPEPINNALVRDGVRNARTRIHELANLVANRGHAFQAIADELQKEATDAATG